MSRVGSWFQTRFRLWIIKSALRRPAPTKLSSADSDSSTRDCYAVFLEGKPDSVVMRVTSVAGKIIYGQTRDPSGPATDTNIELEEISEHALFWRHFYGHDSYESKSVLDYLWHRFSQQALRHYLKERFSQNIYNVTRHFKADRIATLGRLVEEATHKDNDPLSFLESRYVHCMTLSEKMHGARVWSHPDNAYQFRRFQLLLDSLVASGDLTSSDDKYSVTGQALLSLTQFSDDERRHRDSLRQSRWLTILTVVLALTSLAQVYLMWSEP